MSGDAPRPVLVTGANSGIGLATVLELARRGFRTIGSVRSAAKAELVRAAAREAGVTVETRLLDVVAREQCAAVLGDVELYGLVNNAGYGLTGAIEDTSDDEARAILETMVLAPARLARLALPGMRARGGGRIVMMSSIYGRATTPLTGWYQAAKHALEAVSDALRTEVARDGVRVVLIEPGGFRTGVWDDFRRDVDARAGSPYGAAYRRLRGVVERTAPLMRRPEDCARVVATALTSPLPRTRYLVGLDARLTALTSHTVPASVRDRVLRAVLGL